MISKKKKKKKGLRRNLQWFFSRNSKFKAFFPPKIKWSPKKKKKKVFAKIQGDFSSKISQVQTFQGGLFSYWGAIFHFLQKIGLKSTKNMRFCILHKPMGGARAPPPPPLATLLTVVVITFYSPSCLGQETAKRPYGLRVKLPPVYHTRRRLHIVRWILLNVKQGSCEYEFFSVWFDLTGNRTQV